MGQPRLARQRPHRGHGRIGITGDGAVALDQFAVRRVEAGAPVRLCRGLGEEALGDGPGATPAHLRDAGDGQHVLHEGAHGAGILALDRGEQAGMTIFGLHAVGDLVEGAPGGDGPQGPALGHRRHVEGIEEGVGQAHIAEPHGDIGAPKQGEPFEGEPQHLGIRRRGVGAPDRLDAALNELVGLARHEAEDRAEIAVIGALAGPRRLMQAADRNGEFRPQAQFGPVRVLRHEDAPPDILARQFEERLHRLQHGGRCGHVSAGGKMRRQPHMAQRLRATRAACLRSRHRLGSSLISAPIAIASPVGDRAGVFPRGSDCVRAIEWAGRGPAFR